jgi:hypothetical protein
MYKPGQIFQTKPLLTFWVTPISGNFLWWLPGKDQGYSTNYFSAKRRHENIVGHGNKDC